MNAETPIVAQILLAIGSRPDVTVWRNNTGALPNEAGRLVQFGKKGTPDILGFTNGGLFLGIEVKTPARPGKRAGRSSPEQLAFAAVARMRGAFHVVVTSPEEAVAAIDELMRRKGAAAHG